MPTSDVFCPSLFRAYPTVFRGKGPKDTPSYPRNPYFYVRENRKRAIHCLGPVPQTDTCMIDFQFHICTDVLHFEVQPGGHTDAFYVQTPRRPGSRRTNATADAPWPPAEPVHIVLYGPPETDFASAERQQWLFRVFREQLRQQALALLPARLAVLSQRHGLPYSRVSVNAARTRWGSCSTRKSINLSLFLLLLPSHLIDYVLLHELCHTREMNHGPRFWTLLDRLTEGRAQALRTELRNFRPVF